MTRILDFIYRNRTDDRRTDGQRSAHDANAHRSTTETNDATAVPTEALSILQPDLNFTAPPFLQILHGHLFSVCAILSVAFFSASLPLAKPEEKPGANHTAWQETLIPMIVYSVISIGFYGHYILRRESCLRIQLGPAPDANTTVAAASMQWLLLHDSLMKQHLATCSAEITLSVGVFCSLCLLTAKLGQGKDISLQLIAVPLAICEFLKLCIHMAYRIRCVMAYSSMQMDAHTGIQLQVLQTD
jgi:hypothetical protein